MSQSVLALLYLLHLTTASVLPILSTQTPGIDVSVSNGGVTAHTTPHKPSNNITSTTPPWLHKRQVPPRIDPNGQNEMTEEEAEQIFANLVEAFGDPDSSDFSESEIEIEDEETPEEQPNPNPQRRVRFADEIAEESKEDTESQQRQKTLLERLQYPRKLINQAYQDSYGLPEGYYRPIHGQTSYRSYMESGQPDVLGMPEPLAQMQSMQRQTPQSLAQDAYRDTAESWNSYSRLRGFQGMGYNPFTNQFGNGDPNRATMFANRDWGRAHNPNRPTGYIEENAIAPTGGRGGDGGNIGGGSQERNTDDLRASSEDLILDGQSGGSGDLWNGIMPTLQQRGSERDSRDQSDLVPSQMAIEPFAGTNSSPEQLAGALEVEENEQVPELEQDEEETGGNAPEYGTTSQQMDQLRNLMAEIQNMSQGDEEDSGYNEDSILRAYTAALQRPPVSDEENYYEEEYEEQPMGMEEEEEEDDREGPDPELAAWAQALEEPPEWNWEEEEREDEVDRGENGSESLPVVFGPFDPNSAQLRQLRGMLGDFKGNGGDDEDDQDSQPSYDETREAVKNALSQAEDLDQTAAINLQGAALANYEQQRLALLQEIEGVDSNPATAEPPCKSPLDIRFSGWFLATC